MDLTPFVTTLGEELALAAEAGGPEVVALAERLAGPLESAVRLTLLDALTAAADEITRDLAPGSVDLRLRGREPTFVVVAPSGEPLEDEPAPPTTDVEDGGWAGVMTRINLRLDQDLKARVERAARDEGLSVNAWLVRSAALALHAPGGARAARPAQGGDRFTGWVH